MQLVIPEHAGSLYVAKPASRGAAKCAPVYGRIVGLMSSALGPGWTVPCARGSSRGASVKRSTNLGRPCGSRSAVCLRSRSGEHALLLLAELDVLFDPSGQVALLVEPALQLVRGELGQVLAFRCLRLLALARDAD